MFLLTTRIESRNEILCDVASLTTQRLHVSIIWKLSAFLVTSESINSQSCLKQKIFFFKKKNFFKSKEMLGLDSFFAIDMETTVLFSKINVCIFSLFTNKV